MERTNFREVLMNSMVPEIQKKPLIQGLFLFCILVGLFFWTGQQTQQAQQHQIRELVAPPRGLEHLSFGFRASMADGFWVRAIQDFDYCEQPIAKQLCQGRGWLYQTLDVTTDLDPDFRMAYSAGAMALSVIVSDLDGASLLFDKAVAHFPHDWIILYKAAYHALYEEKNQAKAAVLMEQAARNGAPSWVFQLAGRLYTRSGQREMAERLLNELRAQGVDETIQAQLRQRLQEKIEKTPQN